MTRTCRVCHEVLPLTDEHFSRDGQYWATRCKPCVATAARNRYAANPAAAQVRRQQWREQHPESAQATTDRWRKAHSAQYRLMTRAYKCVGRALKSGKLVRPDNCQACGSAGAIEAAHVDYTKPLEVRWLCRRCHRAWDRAEPKGVGIDAR